MKRLLATVLLIACCGQWVLGQEIPTTPGKRTEFAIAATTVVNEVTKEETASDLSELTAHYVKGDWSGVVKKASALLALVEDKCACVLVKEYVHLFWVGATPTADEPGLFSVVLHKDSSNAYSRVIPGIAGRGRPRLMEVFLSTTRGASFASYYVSKPLPDPLLEQVPAVADKFLGPLFGVLDRLDPTTNLQPLWAVTPKEAPDEKPKPQLYAIVAEVTLPEARAGVEVTAKAIFPVALPDMTESLKKIEARFSGPGKSALSEARVRMVITAVGDCQKFTTPDCKTALHEDVTDAIQAARPAASTDAAHRELDRVELALRGWIDAVKPGVVSGKATLDNSPLTHLSFGLLSSFALKTYGSDLRAKVEGGKVSSAPLPRSLQMVVLNISPWGYQSKTARRFRLDAMVRPFVGVVYAPDLGVSAGLSVMVLPNLGINLGYAHLLVTRPEDGLDFGAMLDEKVKDAAGKDTAVFRYSDELRRNPLQRGRLGSTFLGVSYNFK